MAETVHFAPAVEEPGDWIPVHFWLTFDDGTEIETSDIFQIRKVVDALWDGQVKPDVEERLRFRLEPLLFEYSRKDPSLQGPPHKRLVNLRWEMADGFQVEADSRLGRIRLGDVWIHFRETGDQWAKDLIWFRRVRSQVGVFHAGGPGSPPLPSRLHAYGIGFSTGQYGRRVFLLRADRTIEYEL